MYVQPIAVADHCIIAFANAGSKGDAASSASSVGGTAFQSRSTVSPLQRMNSVSMTSGALMIGAGEMEAAQFTRYGSSAYRVISDDATAIEREFGGLIYRALIATARSIDLCCPTSSASDLDVLSTTLPASDVKSIDSKHAAPATTTNAAPAPPRRDSFALERVFSLPNHSDYSDLMAATAPGSVEPTASVTVSGTCSVAESAPQTLPGAPTPIATTAPAPIIRRPKPAAVESVSIPTPPTAFTSVEPTPPATAAASASKGSAPPPAISITLAAPKRPAPPTQSKPVGVPRLPLIPIGGSNATASPTATSGGANGLSESGGKVKLQARMKSNQSTAPGGAIPQLNLAAVAMDALLSGAAGTEDSPEPPQRRRGRPDPDTLETFAPTDTTTTASPTAANSGGGAARPVIPGLNFSKLLGASGGGSGGEDGLAAPRGERNR